MRLDSLAIAVRSKNAGPCLITFDIIFDRDDRFAAATAALPRLRHHVAERYGKTEADIRSFVYPPARAIKITIPRQIMSGSVGDSDVYGAQQHAPLLDFDL